MERRRSEAEAPADRADGPVLGRQTESWEPMTKLQKAAGGFALVFTLIGILGFIPGITTNFEGLELAGPESEALLLGVFQVSILHNVIHLAFGLMGMAAATTIRGARLFLVGGGALYGVLWVYGLVVDLDSAANFVPLNTADNWLHLFLAVAMIGTGLALSTRVGPSDYRADR
jgi:hypothetical protein